MNSVIKYSYDLGFGNPVFARQALSHFYKENTLNILDNSYPDPYGEVELIKKTKDYMFSQTGWRPSYIVITAGATQALYFLIRNATRGLPKILGELEVSVNPFHFPYYPKIAQAAGAKIVGDLPARMFSLVVKPNELLIVDSPGNPTGGISTGKIGTIYNSVWDCAYNNAIYTDNHSLFPQTNCAVGSFAKMFGLAGLRIGFIATDDPSLFISMQNISNTINCGVNLHGQKTLVDIFNKVDVKEYMKKAKTYLDDNRGEFIKLENKFGVNIPKNGMFYPMFFDSSLVDKLRGIGVNVTIMEAINGNDKLIRFSMGQDRELTAKAVKHILTKV